MVDAPTRLPASIAALLAIAGCDALRKADDGAEPATAEAEDPKTKAALDDAQKARKDAEAKAAEAKQAELDALARSEKAEAEAKALVEAERVKNQPVSLSDLSVKRMGSFLSSSGMIEVVAKAKLNQALGNSTYVHIKSLCQHGDKLVADVGYLNAHYSKPLEQHAPGDEVEVKGNLYSQGLEKSLAPCQFEFRVGGLAGGLSIPVGHACWDGSEVAPAECDPPLSPAATSGSAVPIEVQDLRVEAASLGATKGLSLSYLLGIKKPQDNSVRLTFKSACSVGGKTFVDLGQSNLSAGPFRYEPGESVARSVNLYWSNAFGFATSPDRCDVTTSLWKTKSGSFGEYEEVRLRDSCFDGSALRVGRCDPAAPPVPAPVPLSATSVTVDEVQLQLAPPYGATDKFQLKIQADITMAEVVSQNDGINAKVSCKAGPEHRVETAYLFGVELHYLRPGETTRMTASAFGSHPLEVEPKSCAVEFFGGPRFSPTGSEGADLGKFCLKKGKVKKTGKC